MIWPNDCRTTLYILCLCFILLFFLKFFFPTTGIKNKGVRSSMFNLTCRWFQCQISIGVWQWHHKDDHQGNKKKPATSLQVSTFGWPIKPQYLSVYDLQDAETCIIVCNVRNYAMFTRWLQDTWNCVHWHDGYVRLKWLPMRVCSSIKCVKGHQQGHGAECDATVKWQAMTKLWCQLSWIGKPLGLLVKYGCTCACGRWESLLCPSTCL